MLVKSQVLGCRLIPVVSGPAGPRAGSGRRLAQALDTHGPLYKQCPYSSHTRANSRPEPLAHDRPGHKPAHEPARRLAQPRARRCAHCVAEGGGGGVSAGCVAAQAAALSLHAPQPVPVAGPSPARCRGRLAAVRRPRRAAQTRPTRRSRCRLSESPQRRRRKSRLRPAPPASAQLDPALLAPALLMYGG